MFVLIICVIICWVQIIQRVGYELVESGYETSKLGYESSGFERSMGTKRLVSVSSNPGGANAEGL